MRVEIRDERLFVAGMKYVGIFNKTDGALLHRINYRTPHSKVKVDNTGNLIVIDTTRDQLRYYDSNAEPVKEINLEKKYFSLRDLVIDADKRVHLIGYDEFYILN